MLSLGKARNRAHSSISAPKATLLPWARSRASTAKRGWVQRAIRWPDLPAVLCFALLSLVAVSWFRGDYYIVTGDFGWPFDQLKYMHVAAYAWDATVSTGYAATRQVAALPFAILGGLTQSLGISGTVFERLMFAVWFGGSGLSMYALARLIGLSRLASLGSGLFYTLNTFALIAVWSIYTGTLLAFYAFLPLFLGLFIWCYRNRRGWRFAFLANLLLFFSTMNLAFTNPAFPALMWGIASIYVGYDFIVRGIDRYMIRSAGLFFLCWSVMNAFWIAPLVFDVGQQAAIAANVTISDLDTFRLNSVTIDNALRLTGLWSLYAGEGVDPYYPWAINTISPWFMALSFIPSVLIAVALLRGPTRHKDIPLFGLLFLAGIYLVALLFLPFGPQLTTFLQIHFPIILRAFRGGFLKFGFFLALGAAPLVGLGLADLSLLVSRLIGRIGGAVCWTGISVLVFGVLVFPIWTGDVISAGGREYLPSWRVRLPPAYNRLQIVTSGVRQQARLLALPLPPTYNLAYQWGRDAQGRLQGYVGGDFTRWESTLPVIYAAGVDQSGFVQALAQSIDSFSSLDALNRTIGLLNVSIVLLHQDLNPLFDYLNSTHELAMQRLHAQLHGHLSNFGPFSLYTVPSRYVLPMVYTPRYLVNSGPTATDFVRALRDPTLGSFGAAAYAPLIVPPAFLAKSQRDVIDQTIDTAKLLGPVQQRKHHLVVPISSPTTVAFRRVNPTEYDVTIHGVHGRPFALVLGEQFDPGWHAYVVPQGDARGFTVSCDRRQAVTAPQAFAEQCSSKTSFFSTQQLADNFRRPIPTTRHFPINEFANGWVITPQDTRNKSTITIVLDYTPQRHVLLGIGLTVLGIGVALVLAAMRFCTFICGRFPVFTRAKKLA